MTVSNVESLDELMGIIQNTSRVVVDFSAPGWCVPCRRLAPHFEAAAEKLPEITFVEVDVDKAEAIRKQFAVQTVPFVVAFKDGELAGEVKGRTALTLIQEVGSL